jgi:Tfp pilus assembly protein PilF
VPRSGSERYEQVTQAFYVGLASLEVGLLDDARRQFTRVTELVPSEPAAWANLGLTQLRLGELDNAIDPVNRAVQLAPKSSHVALLAGRVETTRGRLDDGIVHMRRAVTLDPESLRARFALAEEIERSGAPGADDEAQQLIDDIVQRVPDNLAALLEGGRLAAKRGDASRLQDAVNRLEPHAASWPAVAMEQFAALQSAAASQNFTGSARAMALLRNVLARVPAFLEGLAAVRTPAELFAEPFDRFVVLETPLSTPSPPDMGLAFDLEPIDGAPGGAQVLAVFAPNGDAPVLFQGDADAVRRIDGAGAWPFPAGPVRLAHSLLAVDWNNDFRTDLVAAGPGGIRLLLQQADGQFEDETAGASAAGVVECECVGAWAADVEMDGDIDLIVSVEDGPPFVLRNAGDGTWHAVADMFPGLTRARAFAWADLDRDADPDAAFLDAAGRLHVYINRQAGDFLPIPVPDRARDLVALTVADANADGMIDLVALDATGAIRRYSLRAGVTPTQSAQTVDALWEEQDLATWSDFQERARSVSGDLAATGHYRLFMADLDNNGALDLVASGPAGTRIWLADETYTVPAAARVTRCRGVRGTGSGR